MVKILITGMSGTGKSTALRALAARGHRTVDTDTDRWSREVLLARIAARTDNPYGKSPAERAAVLDHLAHVEPLLRATATAEIDASAPVDEVVRELERLPGVGES